MSSLNKVQLIGHLGRDSAMFLFRYKVDFALVGERDGFSGRKADARLWRKEEYRRGYAEGLLARATRAMQRCAQVNATTKVAADLEARL